MLSPSSYQMLCCVIPATRKPKAVQRIRVSTIQGARGAFRIGVLVVAANLVVGVLLGALAGYFGGATDEIIMRITDMFYAIPFLIMAMALVVAIGRGLQSIVLVLIVLGWPIYTRVLRGEILVIREKEFVLASRASGASHMKIILKHILPNSVYSVLIVASMQVGTVVLTAAALSFLGLGAGSGYADWGQMVSTCRNWIVGPADNGTGWEFFPTRPLHWSYCRGGGSKSLTQYDDRVSITLRSDRPA